MTEGPLLRAEQARVEADGATLSDSLSFEARGDSVGLVGDWSLLGRLFSGSARVTHGNVTVLGHPAGEAARAGLLGLSLASSPLPEAWSTNEYLAASARLIGFGRFGATRAAKSVLSALELGGLSKRPIRLLRRAERQALGIAQAALGSPEALFLDRPFEGISDPDGAWLRGVIDRAARGRKLIVTARAPSAAGVEVGLLTRLHHVVLRGGGVVVASGRPGEVLAMGPRCLVRASRGIEAFSSALSSRGVLVERPAWPEGPAGAGRLIVHLRRGETSAVIVDAALEAEAPLLELLPLGVDTAPAEGDARPGAGAAPSAS